MTAKKTKTTTTREQPASTAADAEATDPGAPKRPYRSNSGEQSPADPNMRFHARLEPAEHGMSSGRFHVPSHLVPVLGAKASVPVHGMLDGHAFTSNLVPDGEGGMFLPVDQSLRAKAQLKPGDIVEIVLQAIG